jgi:signal transduction histidine kinase/CHASE3 domain sensor protein
MLPLNRFPEANLRLAGLLASLVVIVMAGYLVRQKVSEDTVEAFRWVDHTHEVQAALFELRASLSEMQAAAFGAKLVRGDVEATQQYTEARTRFEPLLDQLRDLTSDSAQQQERVGMLRARIQERVSLFDRSLREGEALDSANLTAAIERIPVEDIADAVLAREQNLADVRQHIADRSVYLAGWATAATALAQILLLGIVIWVSERQLQRRVTAESETRRAIGRARLIVETVREPIAVITADLAVLQANQAFVDFYGLARPISGTLADVPAWRDPALRQRLKDVVTTRRELWDYETEQDAGDTRRHVVVNARPMTLPEVGEAIALLTISDMTLRKRSEEQMLELNRQLSGKIAQVTEVNRELEAFSYSVSHDLRAPLRHIAGFSDKLGTELVERGDDRMRHYCEVIAESARRMSALIEDLLAYSRLGRHALRLQAVDMQSVVDEVRASLMSSIEDRAITWRIAPLPVAIADASMLRLVWQNLLDNAIKYSAGKEEAVIELGVEDSPDERVFWVRDNGAGFDMKYVDKLFGVFQRLHKASAFSGTGIGLASVRRIIARHGGRTWAEGSPDKGATMFFSLPRHEPVS